MLLLHFLKVRTQTKSPVIIKRILEHKIYFVDASPEIKQFIPNERHFATIVDAIAARDQISESHSTDKN